MTGFPKDLVPWSQPTACRPAKPTGRKGFFRFLEPLRFRITHSSLRISLLQRKLFRSGGGLRTCVLELSRTFETVGDDVFSSIPAVAADLKKSDPTTLGSLINALGSHPKLKRCNAGRIASELLIEEPFPTGQLQFLLWRNLSFPSLPKFR